MPQVPIIQGRSVREAPLQGGFQRALDFSSSTRALAGGLDTASQVVGGIADKIDTTAAYDAEVRVKSQWLALDSELRKKHRGVNAPAYAEEADAFWAAAQEGLAGTLSPRAQAIVGKSLGAARLHAKTSALNYVTQETERAQDEAFTASQTAEVQRAAASGDPAVAAVSATLLKQRNAQQAAIKGWSPEQLDAVNTKATTALHANILQGMQVKDPTAALAYFTANKGEIDGTRHAEIERSLTVASAADDGDRAARAVWGELGPKSYNEPVLLDKMEEKARALYPNDPVRRKAAIDAIKERTAAHNAAQAENNAAAVNQVMAVYNSTKSLASMKRSPAWSAMPPAKQAEVENHIVALQTAVLNRAAAAEGRADQAEAREQRGLARRGMAAYLVYSDPAVLAGMSDTQVQALLPTLGNDLTSHLIEKKRAVVKNPAGEAEAKMDKQDFDHIADTMGLKPFAKKSDDEKARLGELQYRVEQRIYDTQREKGKALTREEKNTLMRQELARRVKVSGFFTNDEKAVIQLTKDEVENVIVPPTDKAQLVEAMGTMYERTGSNAFAPSEANLRRFYLLSKSRAADLVAPAAAE